MASITVTAETNVRTLTFAVSGVRPVKADYEYFTVTGARITYKDSEVTTLSILVDDECEFIAVRTEPEYYDMWEPWLRDLVEQHRPTT